MPKPNFFIIGAMKSGTTSLHSYLETHPDVFMSDPKEPSYFVERQQLEAIYPQMAAREFWRGEDRYLALFDEAGEAPVIGESSTNYTKLPRITGCLERLADFAPDAKLLYIMRDPIERTLSHYWHMVYLHGENRRLERALRRDPHYLEVSHYAMQLRPWFERFPRERILLLTFEALRDDPAATLRQVFAWLGVDEDFVPPILDRQHNVTPRRMEKARGLGLLHRFRHSDFWDRVGPLMPKPLRRMGRKLAEEPVDPKSVGRDAAVNFLRPIQREQTAELCELTGREFPEWRTLYGDGG